MNKNLQAGLGALLIFMGVIWTLQGLGVIQSSSAMTDEVIWAIIGPIVALLGALLLVGVFRARRS